MSEFIRVGGLPIVIARGPAWFVLPSDGTAKSEPLGGPFTSPDAARWFVVEYLESHLSQPQRELWREIMGRHTATRDAGHELGVIDMVRRGRTLEQITPYMQRQWHGAVDHRMAAAGEDR